jgi:hypothetical protein
MMLLPLIQKVADAALTPMRTKALTPIEAKPRPKTETNRKPVAMESAGTTNITTGAS